jgi:hypothetical protein
MVKKKKRPIKYIILSIIFLIFALFLFVGGVLILIYLIFNINLLLDSLILNIISLLGCFLGSFVCLIHALSFMRVSWAMRIIIKYINPYITQGSG